MAPATSDSLRKQFEDIRRENARLRTKSERLVKLSEKLWEGIAQLERTKPK
jgi:hypothetical protein